MVLLGAPLRGWVVLRKTLRNFSEHRVAFNAAAAAFYLLLSIIPGIAGIVLVYSFVADPEHVQFMQDFLAKVEGVFREQLQGVAR